MGRGGKGMILAAGVPADGVDFRGDIPNLDIELVKQLKVKEKPLC